MLISVSKKNAVHSIHSDAEVSELELGEKADLFAVIDDLLSIDWIRLDYLARKLTPKEEADALTNEQMLFWGWRRFGLLWHYDGFCGYLREAKSLHKYNRSDCVSPITYELLCKQFNNLFSVDCIGFHRREEDETYRFDNSLLLLNMDDCLGRSDAEDCRALLSAHFPKVTLFSPNTAPSRAAQDYSAKPFRSNFEMLVYDILYRMYPQADSYWPHNLLEYACRELLDLFAPDRYGNKIDAEKARNFYTAFSGEMARLVKVMEEHAKEHGVSFPAVPIGKQQEVSEEARPLLRLLSSRRIYTLLQEEYNREKSDRICGQRRLRSIDFLAADLESPFECYQYVENCYKKYAVQTNNVYNIAKRESVAAFLCLYGRANAGITFKRCRICGHYFVKSKENKQQKECGRCRYVEETNETLKAFHERKQNLLGNYYTAKSRLNSALFGGKPDETLSEWLLGYNKEEIYSKYLAMMKQFKSMLGEVFQFRTQVCVCREYEAFEQIYRSDYGIDLTERFEAEKSLIPGRLKQVLKSGVPLQQLYEESTRIPDFHALYEAYLAPIQSGFLSYFEECATGDPKRMEAADKYLRDGFEAVCEAFEAEHCDTGEMRRRQRELLRVMVPEP